MKNTDFEHLYNQLREKYERHEKIIVQAYSSLKKKEQQLKEINANLECKQKELEEINNELYKNNIINQNNNIELSRALSQLKETQSQLVQTEKMASLGILTAGIAHEINNPLNFIMCSHTGLTEFFENSSYKTDNHIKFLLDSLKEGVERTSSIINGLNEFSRNTETTKEECNIHKIIDNCLTILQHTLKHRVIIEKQFYPDNIIISGNSGKLHQVFLNILTNAEQAIENKGNITIKTSITNKNITITIADTGKGIDKAHLKKITDPFFTTKEPGKGTGLGLSITYNIIKEHNGNITFNSEPKMGTEVKITLPIK